MKNKGVTKRSVSTAVKRVISGFPFDRTDRCDSRWRLFPKRNCSEIRKTVKIACSCSPLPSHLWCMFAASTAACERVCNVCAKRIYHARYAAIYKTMGHDDGWKRAPMGINGSLASSYL